MSPKVIAIIPARWASSRFPGKPLADIAGKPMIQWVYERTLKAEKLSEVLVATDDERIFETVNSFGGSAVMTPEKCASGTDRAAHVARDLDVDAVINVQGDEPLIESDAIDFLATTLFDEAETPMATLVKRIRQPSELDRKDTVWVVLDSQNHALYFSRFPIPFARDIENRNTWMDHFPYYAHIGIYAYRKEFLLRYAQMPISVLEQAEKLEQLRALENGYRIKVGIGDFDPICVDYPGDIADVEERIRELNLL